MGNDEWLEIPSGIRVVSETEIAYILEKLDVARDWLAEHPHRTPVRKRIKDVFRRGV